MCFVWSESATHMCYKIQGALYHSSRKSDHNVWDDGQKSCKGVAIYFAVLNKEAPRFTFAHSCSNKKVAGAEKTVLLRGN